MADDQLEEDLKRRSSNSPGLWDAGVDEARVRMQVACW